MSEYTGNSSDVHPTFYRRHWWIKVVESNGHEFWQTPCGKKHETYVNIEVGHNMRWCKKCRQYLDYAKGIEYES